MKKGSYYTLIAILPLAVLILVFLLPLSFTLSRAFLSDEGFTLSNIREAFTSEYNYRILLFTLKQAFFSVLLSLAIALPGAYLYSNYSFPLRRLVLSLSSLCFVLPSILVVLGFVIFYGNSGFLNTALMKIFSLDEPPLKILYSFKAIIMAHAFLNFPVALSLITDYWSHLGSNEEKAARTMGAGGIKAFTSVTLPRIAPAILSASLLIFLFCFTSFSIILVLGGGPEFTTLEVEIYRRNNISMDSSSAAALAIFSFAANFILLLIYVLSNRLMKGSEKIRSTRIVKPERKSTKAVIIIYTLLLLIFILGPLLSIVARSFISTSSRYGSGFTLDAYRQIFGLIPARGQLTSALPALLNSLIIAVVTAAVSTILSLSLSLFTARMKKGVFDIIAMFPMAISSVTLGLGYFLIKARLPFHNQLTGYLLVILAHMVMTFPFAVRSITPAARALNERMLMAARTLGASDRKASVSVEIPVLRSAIAKAFMFSFALSMGEVNATLTLSEGRIPTLPILLYRLINSYSYQGACALGTILIIMTLAVFLIAEYAERGEKIK